MLHCCLCMGLQDVQLLTQKPTQLVLYQVQMSQKHTGHFQAGSSTSEATLTNSNMSNAKGLPPKKAPKQQKLSAVMCSWDVIDVLSEEVDWPRWAVCNTVHLLDEDNTVPFIARYRKEKTNNMEAEKIRQVKDHLDTLRVVQAKVESVYKAVDKLGKVETNWKTALSGARTLGEVEHLYAPFKPGSKRSLAERAKELGLESVVQQILSSPRTVNLQTVVRPQTEGLTTLSEVQKGLQHILADLISKDKDIMDAVRRWCKTERVLLKSTKHKTPTTKDGKIVTSKNVKVKQESGQGQGHGHDKQEASKYELYFDFSASIRTIKPHQVLAINRGVAKKFLSQKIVIPDSVQSQVVRLVEHRFVHPQADGSTRQLIRQSAEDAYSRLIEPMMVRHFKSELTKTAEKASIEVFASNLKRLLLTPPVRGLVVLGVDPGFKHGCKYSVVSANGCVLDTGVFYPHTYTGNKKMEAHKIIQTMIRHRCETVAIGNGTACRETEALFADLIKSGALRPLRVKFCIVNEAGASVYSASPEGTKEMPDLDVSLRGAVSIARRLQDPMAELVKIEPKHIGVGMYQHDISETQLRVSLDGVIEDCVSFVGVDVNTASEVLLRRIAGLTLATAKKIVSHRETTGPFINREQLLVLKGLGDKTYKQCAGFIRVLPSTRGPQQERSEQDDAPVLPSSGGNRKRKVQTKTSTKNKKAKMAASLEPNTLDMTSIHPESYDVTDRVMSLVGVNKHDIGSTAFIDTVKGYLRKTPLESLAERLDTGLPTLKLIRDALIQPVGSDMRDEFEKPLFKEGLRQMSDLKLGDELHGRVTNMVHFGAFVDVGVGRDGLIHSSQIRPHLLEDKKSLELGDRVKVAVSSVDVNKGRLGLRLTGLMT